MKESNQTKLNTSERPDKGDLPPLPQNAAKLDVYKTIEKIWGYKGSL